jgi:hypothetical protein
MLCCRKKKLEDGSQDGLGCCLGCAQGCFAATLWLCRCVRTCVPPARMCLGFPGCLPLL